MRTWLNSSINDEFTMPGQGSRSPRLVNTRAHAAQEAPRCSSAKADPCSARHDRGCVDAQSSSSPRTCCPPCVPFVELNLGDEEAWEIGLTCGGTIEVSSSRWPASTGARASHTGKGGGPAIVTRSTARWARRSWCSTTARCRDARDKALDESFTREAREAYRRPVVAHASVDNVRAFVECSRRQPCC